MVDVNEHITSLNPSETFTDNQEITFADKTRIGTLLSFWEMSLGIRKSELDNMKTVIKKNHAK